MRAFITMLLLLCGSLLPGQTILSPSFDASAGAPGHGDNSEILVVQPSQHGTVIFSPFMTGDAGFLGFPILSLEANYQASNNNIFDTFANLDAGQYLVFPNPLVGNLLNWQNAINFFDGTTPLAIPAFEISSPFFQDIAMYIQVAQLDVNNFLPLNPDFSRGLTLINIEPVADNRDAPPSAMAGAQAGRALAAGDLNGDGIDDLVVGAPGDLAGGFPLAGRIYIYLGTPSGLEDFPYILQEPDISSQIIGLQVPPGVATGPAPGARFGDALAVGNLDADPEAELVVGVPNSDGFSSEPALGEVFVFSDLASLFQQTPLTAPQPITPPPASIIPLRPDQNDPNAVRAAGDRFGTSLAIGDTNGDGQDDVVLSAPFKDESSGVGVDRGLVYLFLGPFVPTGFPNPFKTNDFLIQDDQPEAGDLFGTALVAKDMDGDQIAEIVVGVPGQVIQGHAAAGKAAIYTWSSQSNAPVLLTSFSSTAPASSAFFGQALDVGDVNGSGMLDLVVGSDGSNLPFLPQAGGSGTLAQSGRVHLFRLSTAFGTVDTDVLAPSAPQPLERFGSSVTVADINDDGLADVLVGAPGTQVGGQPGAGRIFVHLGSKTGSFQAPFRTIWLSSVSPASMAGLGISMTTGDFTGNHVRDVAAGVPLATVAGVPGRGRVATFQNLLNRRNNPTLPQILAGNF